MVMEHGRLLSVLPNQDMEYLLVVDEFSENLINAPHPDTMVIIMVIFGDVLQSLITGHMQIDNG